MKLARLRLGLVIGVLAIGVSAGAWVVGRGFRAQTLSPGAHLFDQVLSHVAEDYVDSLAIGSLYTRAAAGVVRELGDPHSVYLAPVRLARVQASITGLVGNLGLDIDVRDGWVNVVATLPRTPAEQAGLRNGDHIIAIDGRSTDGWTTDEARRALRGAPGTSVRVSVARPGAAGHAELVIERAAVYVRPVHSAMLLAGGTGYVMLRTFSDSAALELAAAIDSLHKAGMRALILDLRNNPGGLLAQGTAVADLFLDPGQTIVSLRGRTQETRRKFVDERRQAWKDLRVAVLVNRGTASASEIVAGALQDHDRALVIGRPTYGKGSAQHVFSFREQAGIKLTTARWYTPSGRNIDLIAPPVSDDQSPGRADSIVRPAFKTDSGRTVYGGGGIVPDILAGDSTSRPRTMLFAAFGTDLRKLFAAVTAESKVIAARGVSDPLFDVTPAMRDAVYARLVRSGVKISRTLFDGASDWIDARIGAETVRFALGDAVESRRLVLRDRVVQEAVRVLDERAARTDGRKGRSGGKQGE